MGIPDLMKSRRRWLAILVLAVVAVGFIAAWQAARPWMNVPTTAPPPDYVDWTATPVLAQRLWHDGEKPGHPTALIYARETCPYCRAELRHWASVMEANEDLRDSIELVVVSGDSATAYANVFIPASLVVRRVYDTDGAIGRELGVAAVPYTLYLSSDARVVSTAIGETSRREIETAVLALLGGGGH